MNKKTQSKPIAKLAKVATEESRYAVIINTEKPAARKGEKRERQQVRKDSNASTVDNEL